MNFVAAIISAYRNYFSFEGRATRREFWYFNLFVGLLGAGRRAIDHLSKGTAKPEHTLLVWLYVILLLITISAFLPSIALQVRRLHDVGRSGWWVGAGFFILAIDLSVVLTFLAGRHHALLASKFGHPLLVLHGLVILSASLVIYELIVFILCVRPSYPYRNKFGPPRLI